MLARCKAIYSDQHYIIDWNTLHCSLTLIIQTVSSYGATVSTASSQTIISDTNLSIINNIRLLVEKDSSWPAEKGPSLMFAKDVTELVASAIGITAPGTTSDTNGGFKT